MVGRSEEEIPRIAIPEDEEMERTLSWSDSPSFLREHPGTGRTSKPSSKASAIKKDGDGSASFSNGRRMDTSPMTSPKSIGFGTSGTSRTCSCGCPSSTDLRRLPIGSVRTSFSMETWSSEDFLTRLRRLSYTTQTHPISFKRREDSRD